MKTSVVKPVPWGADNGIDRIALAVFVAAGALSAMGVGLTIFLIVISDRATLYGAALIPLGIVSALGIVLVAALVAEPWILTTRISRPDTPLNSRRSE